MENDGGQGLGPNFKNAINSIRYTILCLKMCYTIQVQSTKMLCVFQVLKHVVRVGCPADAVVLTTNITDHQLLANAVGKVVDAVQQEEEGIFYFYI